MNAKKAFGLLKETFSDWSEDKCSRLAASLSYFTIFSIAPLLVIVIAVAGLVLGRESVQNQIIGQLQGLVGQQSAQTIQAMIQNANKPSTGIFATVIGIVTLLLGASGVFGALQDALNTIWGVTPDPHAGLMVTLRNRFVSFSMILVVGFLLLVSLVLSAALAVVGKYVGGMLPSSQILAQAVNFVISFVVVTVLFAMIYKILPDVKIAWSDVWIGAAATSLLFTIGRLLIGLYLGRSSLSSSYGAAGSLVVVLVWVYYSAMILFLGAEFTKVYAYHYGSRIQPADQAVPVTEEARAEQGIPSRQRVEESAAGAKKGGRQQGSPGSHGAEGAPQPASAGDRAASPAARSPRQGMEPASAGSGRERPQAAPGTLIARARDETKRFGGRPAARRTPYALGLAGFLLAIVAFAVRGGPGFHAPRRPQDAYDDEMWRHR